MSSPYSRRSAPRPLPYRMPFPQYGANLYALNSLGEQWLNQTVTLATFRGPPIVLVTTTMSDTDPDILAVVDFANYWNGPRVAVCPTYR